MPDSGRRSSRDFDVLAFASSAGGVTALQRVLGALPGDFPLAVLLVQHLDPHHRTVLHEVLQRHCALRVKLAEDGERPLPGTVYVAPPNRHLVADPEGGLLLTESPTVHFVRPSADLLLESLAEAYRSRVVACVLTGTGTDGVRGVSAVHSAGGTVIVQDPETADFPGMPSAALATGDVDLVLSLEEIPAALARLVGPEAAT